MPVQSAPSSTAAPGPILPEAGPERTPLIELLNVSKSFSTGNQSPVTILDQVNLQVGEGEMLALLGQSGSGKSTILRLMAGLAEPTSGQVHCHGHVLSGVNRMLSIVFQSFALYPWLTVSENVEIGLTGQRLSRKQEEAEVERALELIGLSGYENAYPKELSGGMRQRVGFARAIVAKPEVLCMDEAFSALDVLTAENLRTEVVNLWQDRQSEQGNLKSIFFVTHNIAEAVFMATRIVIISSHPGRIKHVIENALPYPRDVNSKGFQALVDQIHAAIVALALPDEPAPAVTPARTGEESKQTTAAVQTTRPGHVESIPQVSVGRISGLLEILEDSTETVDLFELSLRIGKEFSDTISIVKAAEMLDLVDTPKQDVFLTDLGREFLAGDQADRKAIFARQILKLRLFQIICGSLRKAAKPVDADIILQELAILLPYDKPEKLFETIVAWGRYAELIDYDQDTHTVFVQEEEEEEEEAAADAT
jgi:NitT/TauT family transport system ATP-binding protein